MANTLTPFIIISIDLETLGTSAGHKILSIGAAAELITFSDNDEVIGHANYAIQRHGQGSLKEDATTIEWWEKQSVEAIQAAFHDPDAVPLANALEFLKDQIKGLENRYKVPVHVLGNGANFDIAFLEAAYNEMQMAVPWNYKNVQCLRTLRNLFPDIKAPDFRGTKHTSLDDAINQLEYYKKFLYFKIYTAY